MDDFSNIEDLINRKVKMAMNCVDMARDKVNRSRAKDVLNDVLSGVKNGVEFASKKIENAKLEEMRKREYIIGNMKKDEMQLYISKKPVGRISGTVLSILGVIGIVFNSLVISGFVIGFFASAESILLVLIAVFSVFLIGNIVMLSCGSYKRKRVKRFRKYVTCLYDKGYCKVNKLSESVNKDNSFVVKDLRKMLELDMFKQGHIDEEETYFILSDKIYNDYVMMQEAYKKRKEEEARKEAEMAEDNIDKSRYDITIERGQQYINQVKTANEYINDGNMSLKLNKLEQVLNEIFKNIKENPENISYVRKSIEHYLPMTIKLLNSYIELSSQSIQGDNIKSAKKEIEESIDLINKAFENLLDDLFEEVAMDISTDISALKTLFNQDGLTEDNLKK